jgi:hypothetical protein
MKRLIINNLNDIEIEDMQTFATFIAIESLLLDKLTPIIILQTNPFPGLKSQRRFASIRLQMQNGHPEGWPLACWLWQSLTARSCAFDSYALSLRLMRPASPASPLPSSRKLEGSGVTQSSGVPSILKVSDGIGRIPSELFQ